MIYIIWVLAAVLAVLKLAEIITISWWWIVFLTTVPFIWVLLVLVFVFAVGLIWNS